MQSLVPALTANGLLEGPFVPFFLCSCLSQEQQIIFLRVVKKSCLMAARTTPCVLLQCYRESPPCPAMLLVTDLSYVGRDSRVGRIRLRTYHTVRRSMTHTGRGGQGKVPE